MCRRCRTAFSPPVAAAPQTAAISDCGILLDSFAGATTAPRDMPPKPSLDASRGDLRRLERMLQPQYRRDSFREVFDRPLLRGPRAAPEDNWMVRKAVVRRDAFESRGDSYARPQRVAWGVSLMLLAGGLAFACGIALLVAANLMMHAAAWRWGFAMTMAGEGLLIGGLTTMAVRLWRNSRRLNAQLATVDRRLEEFQAGAGSALDGMHPPTPLRRVDSMP